MFQKMKSMLGGNSQSRLERAATFDLEGKPIAKALLLRAAQYQDEAILYARQMGIASSVSEEKSLNDFAAGCAVTIAHKITTDAQEIIGQRSVFLPYDEVPKHARMVVAFSLFVLECIHAHLKSEEIELDFAKDAAETAGLFFAGHPHKERLEHAMRGIATFQSAAQTNLSTVKDLQDGLYKMVPLYILQWTTTNEGMKKVDSNRLFASMLHLFLKEIE